MIAPWLNKYNIFINWLKKGHIIRKFKIKKYLLKNSSAKLQIAPGELPIKKPGWLTADLYTGDIYLNAKRKLPFPDNSFSFIYSEHFLEHIEFRDACKLLAELYRIIKPNGIIRFSLPDLEKIAKIYLSKDKIFLTEFFNLLKKIQPPKSKWLEGRTTLLSSEYMNVSFYGFDHIAMWDSELLTQTLQSIGFDNVRFYECGISENEELDNIERHGEIDSLNNQCVMCVEVRKPKVKSQIKPEIFPTIKYFLNN